MLKWISHQLKTLKAKKAKPKRGFVPPPQGIESDAQEHSYLAKAEHISYHVHGIKPKAISQGAREIISKLHDAGYLAFVVGGCVRDLLLGQKPKDFDVVTDAHPEQIRRLFRYSRLIGRRFKLVHVRIGVDTIEVATFRSQLNATGEQPVGDESLRSHNEDGVILYDNVYGTMEEDAFRRDFTINALYYDPTTSMIYDYVGGFGDVQKQQIQLIGDAVQRYREDPVRMLRAVRFAAKLDVHLTDETKAPIAELAELLYQVPPARLFDEFMKLFTCGNALKAFQLLQHYSLFQTLFPNTQQCLDQDSTGFDLGLIHDTLINTDKRIAEKRPITPAFLYAAFLWPVRMQMLKPLEKRYPLDQAHHQSNTQAIEQQNRITAIPRRLHRSMHVIWNFQRQLIMRKPRWSNKISQALPYGFRAAYDFLLLRAQTEQSLQEAAQWWTQFIDADSDGQQEMVKALQHKRSKQGTKRGRKHP